jgi:hypothetical protein
MYQWILNLWNKYKWGKVNRIGYMPYDGVTILYRNLADIIDINHSTKSVQSWTRDVDCECEMEVHAAIRTQMYPVNYPLLF